MRVYPISPDPDAVRNHFVQMAKNEVKTTGRRQVGYGFVGSRLKLGGRSMLGGGIQPPVVLKPMVPSEVGLQQAKSELLAQKIQKETGGGRGVLKRQTSGNAEKMKTKKSKDNMNKNIPGIKKAVKRLISHSAISKQRSNKVKKPKKKRKKVASRDNLS